MKNAIFLGSLQDAPTSAQKAAGSLLPVEDGATVWVLHVPEVVSRGMMHHAPTDLHVPAISLADAHTHLSIILERGSTADIAIWLEGDHAQVQSSIEVILADEASCTVLCVNVASPNADVQIKQQASIGAGAKMQWQNVTLGGKVVDHSLVSTVTGHDGESAVDWMFYAKGTEKQTCTVRNIFEAQNGRGEILMRGIAEEKGHAVCRGMINIGLKGGGTNTYLTQEVLMLDASSKVDAIPALEIKTNDVKASHSATVARVTEEDLFYFGARGIDPNEARKMFVLGFLGDITGRIQSEQMRERVVEGIEKKYKMNGRHVKHG